jgi:hypothetical protein
MPAITIEAAAGRREVSYQFFEVTCATASSLRKDGFRTVRTEPGAEPFRA